MVELIDILLRRAGHAHNRLRKSIHWDSDRWYNRQGYIYLVYFGFWDIYKIGIARKVDQRYTQIGSVEAPFEFRLEHTIYTDDTAVIEASLHEYFAPKRLRGEWFRLTADDIALIKSMQDVFVHDAAANGDAETLIKPLVTDNEDDRYADDDTTNQEAD